MYSTGCPRCKTLGMMLDKKNISYTVNSSLDDMNKMGFASVPMLDVDGTLLTYEEAMKWIVEHWEDKNEKQ